jgi:flagellar basal body-associated protein FliL
VAAKEDPAAKPPEHVVKVGTIVVNVAGTDGRRYLRTTLELGAKAKESKHLEELRAPLLDAAIGILGGKPLPELLDPEERDGLREELLERLNEVTGGHGISHVFLTEFVVQ